MYNILKKTGIFFVTEFFNIFVFISSIGIYEGLYDKQANIKITLYGTACVFVVYLIIFAMAHILIKNSQSEEKREKTALERIKNGAKAFVKSNWNFAKLSAMSFAIKYLEYEVLLGVIWWAETNFEIQISYLFFDIIEVLLILFIIFWRKYVAFSRTDIRKNILGVIFIIFSVLWLYCADFYMLGYGMRR